MKLADSALRVVLSFCLLLPPWAEAIAGPQLMNYQGKLTDSNGNPVTTPPGQPDSMVFAIYDAPTGGNQLWTETQSVAVSNGLFSVQLGAGTPLPSSVFSGATTYLDVNVGGESLLPRRRLAMSPYAGNTDLVQGKNFSMLYPGANSLGIGAAPQPWSALDSHGDISISAPDALGDAILTSEASGAPLLLKARSGPNYDLFVNTNGNIGIGTGSPAGKLDVHDGSIVLSSQSVSGTGLIFPDGTKQTTAYTGGGGGISIGSNNFFIGGAGNTTLSSAYNNTGVGPHAVSAVSTGGGNTGIGFYALADVTSGTLNTALGVGALNSVGTSFGDTAVGASALQSDTGGGGNTAVGFNALYAVTTGTNNTAVGEAAGFNGSNALTTGSNNVFIGYGSGGASPSISNAVAIGANAIVSQSGSIALGASGAEVDVAGTLKVAGQNSGFGGMFQVDDCTGCGGLDSVSNWTTGGCGCPSGFTAHQFGRIKSPETGCGANQYICIR